MPAYEYVCKECRKDVTIFLSIRDYESNPKIKCPHCGSDQIERKITGFSVKTSKKS